MTFSPSAPFITSSSSKRPTILSYNPAVWRCHAPSPAELISAVLSCFACFSSNWYCLSMTCISCSKAFRLLLHRQDVQFDLIRDFVAITLRLD